MAEPSTSKPQTGDSHPKTSEMVFAAVKHLQTRKGVSLSAIKKFIAENYPIDITKYTKYILKSISKALESGKLERTTGRGANGSFKLTKDGQIEKAIKKKKESKTNADKKKGVKKEGKANLKKKNNKTKVKVAKADTTTEINDEDEPVEKDKKAKKISKKTVMADDGSEIAKASKTSKTKTTKKQTQASTSRVSTPKLPKVKKVISSAIKAKRTSISALKTPSKEKKKRKSDLNPSETSK